MKMMIFMTQTIYPITTVLWTLLCLVIASLVGQEVNLELQVCIGPHSAVEKCVTILRFIPDGSDTVNNLFRKAEKPLTAQKVKQSQQISLRYRKENRTNVSDISASFVT
jgi:hypothetical protein